MLFCKCMFAKPSEHVAQPLMRLRRLRVDLQRAFVKLPCLGEVTVLKQGIAEIDQRAQIPRMVFKRFAVGQPRRLR